MFDLKREKKTTSKRAGKLKRGEVLRGKRGHERILVAWQRRESDLGLQAFGGEERKMEKVMRWSIPRFTIDPKKRKG